MKDCIVFDNNRILDEYGNVLRNQIINSCDADEKEELYIDMMKRYSDILYLYVIKDNKLINRIEYWHEDEVQKLIDQDIPFVDIYGEGILVNKPSDIINYVIDFHNPSTLDPSLGFISEEDSDEEFNRLFNKWQVDLISKDFVLVKYFSYEQYQYQWSKELFEILYADNIIKGQRIIKLYRDLYYNGDQNDMNTMKDLYERAIEKFIYMDKKTKGQWINSFEI